MYGTEKITGRIVRERDSIRTHGGRQAELVTIDPDGVIRVQWLDTEELQWYGPETFGLTLHEGEPPAPRDELKIGRFELTAHGVEKIAAKTGETPEQVRAAARRAGWSA